MGLSSRKKSGKLIGGSTLIVVGEPIYSVKKFEPNITKKNTYQNNDYREISPQIIEKISPPLIDTNYILTEDFLELMSEIGDNLVWR